MNKFEQIENKLLREISEHNITRIKSITDAELGVRIASNAIIQLREQVINHGFESIKEEIHFFKVVKPKIFAHLIFYTHIMDIELKGAISNPKDQKKYIRMKLDLFQKLFQDNIDFISYIQNESTHLDEFYFVRKSERIPIININYDYYLDPIFNTSHDHLVAMINAYKLITQHILKYRETNNIEYKSNSVLYWTDTKTSIVELIYALQGSGSINKGTAEIKDICHTFEEAFNIDLHDIYRIFHELTLRKSDRTKYMTKLEMDLATRLENIEGLN